MKPSKVVFANLRAEMSRENITLIDLAKTIGCTRDTMSNWLSRKTQISLETAFIIQKTHFPKVSIWCLFSELCNENDKAS